MYTHTPTLSLPRSARHMYSYPSHSHAPLGICTPTPHILLCTYNPKLPSGVKPLKKKLVDAALKKLKNNKSWAFQIIYNINIISCDLYIQLLVEVYCVIHTCTYSTCVVEAAMPYMNVSTMHTQMEFNYYICICMTWTTESPHKSACRRVVPMST